jgi:adenylate cyclase
MLFADVRGSTGLAEGMSASDFSRLMDRFYKAATEVLIKTDAFIDKLVGDEVIGLYLPLFSGPDHARIAVLAAKELLKATGHERESGPWLPIGVGVHTGIVYVGVVSGAEGTVADVTALGDNMNIAARLASSAGPGELVISDDTFTAASIDSSGFEQHQLELKGKSEIVDVYIHQSQAS